MKKKINVEVSERGKGREQRIMERKEDGNWVKMDNFFQQFREFFTLILSTNDWLSRFHARVINIWINFPLKQAFKEIFWLFSLKHTSIVMDTDHSKSWSQTRFRELRTLYEKPFEIETFPSRTPSRALLKSTGKSRKTGWARKFAGNFFYR